MINRDEIEAKGLEFGIHVADVQRDYVFGWFLLGVYTATTLKDSLILKGGNCFRKAEQEMWRTGGLRLPLQEIPEQPIQWFVVLMRESSKSFVRWLH